MNETSLKNLIEQKFGTLEEKDKEFKKLCKEIQATREDLNFFREGLHEINGILNEINHDILSEKNPEEKARLIQKKLSWEKESQDYYIEMTKVQNSLKEEIKEQAKIVDYTNLIRNITSYDELKQHVYQEIKEGEFNYHRILKLHELQERINKNFQQITNTNDILEEKSVLPRLALESEFEEDYLDYLKAFLVIPEFKIEIAYSNQEPATKEWIDVPASAMINDIPVIEIKDSVQTSEISEEEMAKNYGFELIEETITEKSPVETSESKIEVQKEEDFEFHNSLEEFENALKKEQEKRLQKIEERITVYFNYKNYIYDKKRTSKYPEIYDPVIEYLDTITEEKLNDLNFDLNLPNLPEEPIEVEEKGFGVKVLGDLSDNLKKTIEKNKRKLLITGVIALGIIASKHLDSNQKYSQIELEPYTIEQEAEQNISLNMEIPEEKHLEEQEIVSEIPVVEEVAVGFKIGDQITLNNLEVYASEYVGFGADKEASLKAYYPTDAKREIVSINFLMKDGTVERAYSDEAALAYLQSGNKLISVTTPSGHQKIENIQQIFPQEKEEITHGRI